VIQEINSWLTRDIRNKGFCHISWYAYSGTNSARKNIDIDVTLSQMDKAMRKKTDYDSYMYIK
jgi:hypothetical protein